MLFLNKNIFQTKVILTIPSVVSIFFWGYSGKAQNINCSNYWTSPQTGKIECLDSLVVPINSHRFQSKNKYVDKNTGVEIIWQIEPNIFPPEWSSASTKLQATALSTEEMPRHLLAVKKAINKYPPNLIKGRLEKIYLVNNLKNNDTNIGGYYIGKIKTIYLNNRGVDNGYSDRFLEAMFHHEFSSFLFHQYANAQFKSKWLKANEPDFEYGEGKKSIDFYREKQEAGINTNIIREDCLQAGFLNIYSKSHLENDFNEIAEHIFVDGDRILQLANQYPNLGKKVALFIELYSSIDSQFAADYFRNL